MVVQVVYSNLANNQASKDLDDIQGSWPVAEVCTEVVDVVHWCPGHNGLGRH